MTIVTNSFSAAHEEGIDRNTQCGSDALGSRTTSNADAIHTHHPHAPKFFQQSEDCERHESSSSTDVRAGVVRTTASGPEFGGTLRVN